MRSLLRCSLSIALLLIAPVTAAETDFSYFAKPELNFWKSTTAAKDVTAAKSSTGPRVAPSTTGKNTFPWQKYLDPKHDEFFREGDYSPPAPFMEIARDPSDANIENWFRYLELKNQLLHRLQDKLTAYATSHPKSLPALPSALVVDTADAPAIVAKAATQLGSSVAPRPDTKKFRLRLYFDSHCPHCEHMIATTLRELAGLGYWIELRQVDRDASVRARIPFPVTSATPQELKQYGIESVPVLLVGDLKARSFFKMQGDQSAAAVVAALGQSIDKAR